jgi:hypothetical protein
MIILIPLPLFFAQTVYTKAGLTTWVVVGIIWTFFSAFSVVIYPLFESRVALTQIGRGIIKVLCCLSSNDGKSVLILHRRVGHLQQRQREVCCPEASGTICLNIKSLLVAVKQDEKNYVEAGPSDVMQAVLRNVNFTIHDNEEVDCPG